MAVAAQPGLWVRNPMEVTDAFRTDFILLKHSRPKPLDFSQVCAQFKEVSAWVSRRLVKGEALAEEAGGRLGRSLLSQYKSTCVSSIELDLEPLPTPPLWLRPFVLAVKKEMGLPVRLAVPTLSETSLGNAPSWTPAQAKEALGFADGLDLMLYDTGVGDAPKYQALLKTALVFASRAPENKTVTLGLPNYDDKTALHNRQVENLSTVFEFLKGLSENDAKVLCRPGVRTAFYSAWTLDDEEAKTATKIAQWLAQRCQTAPR